MSKNLKVSIKTFGCQMNFYDSEVAAGILKSRGYELVQDWDAPEPGENGSDAKIGGSRDGSLPENRPLAKRKEEWYEAPADIVVMNTCSVREHAEDRVASRLGMLAVAKKEKPDLILGLMGCMVEEHREKLFRRFPQLDFLAGTRNLKDLPDLIEEARTRRTQVARIRRDGIAIEYTELTQRTSPSHAWLPVMTGCNKVCTFCIVPKTRGAEVSMKARDVYREACRLVDDGVVSITLLGQNVNSYRGEEAGRPHVSFAELLDLLCGIEGLKRISFTTSHPHDATEDLFQRIAKHPKISRRFHLPLQSGSDKILKRMKRLHTYEEFRNKIARLRELVPDVAVTTDLITGFSGETEADHEATLRAMREIEFDGAYIFKYSLRPGTPAAKLSDDVPLVVKEKRNRELLVLQKEIERKRNTAWIGRSTRVFLETRSAKQRGRLRGRSDQDKSVSVEAPESFLGKFVKVRLDNLHHETFQGTLLEEGDSPGTDPGLSLKHVTREEMRALERSAIESHGIPALTLMENAGREAARIFQEAVRSEGLSVTKVLVLAGRGNNGGDALVAARYLAEAGYEVRVVLLADPAAMTPESAANYQKLKGWRVRMDPLPESAERIAGQIRQADAVIDGIYGIGLSRAVSGADLDLIRALNRSGKPVLALDLPSGMDADTGEALPEAVRARWTVTFGYPKAGFQSARARALLGKLYVADIGFPLGTGP